MFATYKKTTSLCHKVMHATVPADIEDRLISFLRGHLGSKKPGKQP